MLRPADSGLSPAQALLCGRVSDSVSGAGLDRFDATLTYEHPAGGGMPAAARSLPVRLGRRAGGWFVLALPDVRRMPAVPAPVAVKLTVRVTAPGRAPVERSRTVDGKRLAVVTTTMTIG